MSPWTAAVLALLPMLALAILSGLRGGLGARFAAFQLAGTLAAFLLVLLTFATDQPATTDLALALTVLAFPGSLLFAVFLERWL